jgi:succinate dehydrogenase / fumarate reductase membrane anchor subunit
MVTKVTSLTGSGMRDWLIQRVTAWLLLIYTVFLVGYCVAHAPLQYLDWASLFTSPIMRVATFLALLSVVYHTWVGIWTVLTDYVKPAGTRLMLQVIIILALSACLIWGTAIVWAL